ncbi:hypothetical protein [Segetibacter koreensis]|uniref:hypothetical protein n=1 Tax=Segetibacter koreensis TaxID=398037 RepID=UPI0003813CB4|nr:hypothetical protein [Segetibacter koreensis]
MRNHSRTKSYFLAGLLMCLAACSTISKFDQYAYTQTTSLKVDACNLMSHATESYNDHAMDVQKVETDINKMFEYEKNRPKNEFSEKMWSILKDSTGHLFGGFVRRWQREGKLNAAFVAESRALVGQSFDQISQLESGKIKPTQISN